MQSKRPGPPLQVQQALSTDATIIECKNPFTPHKTLGHYKAPAGGHLMQREILGDTLELYATKVQTSTLTNMESRQYYESCYLKSVGYVLGQCFFDKKDSEDIEKQAICVFVSKTGYNRNMAKAICDGTFAYGGSAFTTLCNVQGIEQIKNFLCHARSHSKANKLLRIALSWLQHQSGWHTSILTDVDTVFPHLESC
eukprot:872636-Ditylum_brightwellii.AAC.1